MGETNAADAAQNGFDEADLAAIRDSIAAVLSAQCSSIALHAHIDGKTALADQLDEQARDLGWLAIGLAEERGGFGLGARGLQLLHLELGKVVAPGSALPSSVAARVLAEMPDDGYPAATVVSDWLARLLSGDVQAAVPAVVNGAIARGTDGGLIGTLTLLGAPHAGIALVPVGETELALVELAGLENAALDFWDRTRCLRQVRFDNIVPVAWLGPDDAPRRALARNLAIAVAADSIGLARSIADKTIAYMNERIQFGRPIGSFQALKHRAVELVARIGIAEHTLAQAVEVADVGDIIADMWARLAKAAATDVAVFVAGDCVQLHGGVGFTWEYDVHLYLKRARLNEMLVADNLALRDAAAADLAKCTRIGQTTLELPTL